MSTSPNFVSTVPTDGLDLALLDHLQPQCSRYSETGFLQLALLDHLRPHSSDDKVRRDPRSWLSLRWRHNGHDGVSNHQPYHCLFNRLFRRRSKKTSKLRVTGLCAGNSPGTGEFPAQMASNAENVSIWWRHHVARPFTTTELTIKLDRILDSSDSVSPDGAIRNGRRDRVKSRGTQRVDFSVRVICQLELDFCIKCGRYVFKSSLWLCCNALNGTAIQSVNDINKQSARNYKDRKGCSELIDPSRIKPNTTVMVAYPISGFCANG